MRHTQSYSQFLRNVRRFPMDTLGDYIDGAIRGAKHFAELRGHIPVEAGLFIISYPENRYLHADNRFAAIAGLSPSELTRHRASEVRKVYEPDNALFDQRLFADRMRFFERVPVDEREHYSMRCTYRAYDAKGGIINVMQDSRFVRSAPNGSPLVSIGIVTDITDVRCDNRMVNTIYKEGKPVWNDTYYAVSRDSNLTRRESQVAGLLCEGLTNKEIARRLYLSGKTVDNHRQSIYKKTNCRNVAELAKYVLGSDHLGLCNVLK